MSPTALREIPGIPPSYRVCEEGLLWTSRSRTGNDTDEWRPMKPYRDWRGCLYAVIHFQPGRKRIGVHRLVLMAFVGPCPEGMECRHLDGNASNNRPDNLCWGTHLENERDKFVHGIAFVGSKNPMSKLTEEAVIEIRRLRAEGLTCKTIGLRFGVSAATASYATRNCGWRHVAC